MICIRVLTHAKHTVLMILGVLDSASGDKCIEDGGNNHHNGTSVELAEHSAIESLQEHDSFWNSTSSIQTTMTSLSGRVSAFIFEVKSEVNQESINILTTHDIHGFFPR